MDNKIKINLIIKYRRRYLVKYSIEPLNMEEARMIYRELQDIKSAIFGNEIDWIIEIGSGGIPGGCQMEEINNRTQW